MELDLPSLDLLEVLGYAFWFIFAVWPLTLVSVLRATRQLLSSMVAIWTFMALARLFLIFSPVPPLFTIIPEPVNTVTFLVTGAILWVLVVTRALGKQRSRVSSPESDGIHLTSSGPLAVEGRIGVPIPLCRRCRVPMVLRTASRGKYKGQQFYGCPNYPECSEIVPCATMVPE